MASITLKNIPDDLHALYKRRAKKNSRSLQAEILVTLSERREQADAEEVAALDDLIGILSHDGPPVSVEEMHEGVSQMFRETWK